MKPPVEAPTSRAMASCNRQSNAASPAASFSPPRLTYRLGAPSSRTSAWTATRAPHCVRHWPSTAILPARMSAWAWARLGASSRCQTRMSSRSRSAATRVLLKPCG